MRDRRYISNNFSNKLGGRALNNQDDFNNISECDFICVYVCAYIYNVNCCKGDHRFALEQFLLKVITRWE